MGNTDAGEKAEGSNSQAQSRIRAFLRSRKSSIKKFFLWIISVLIISFLIQPCANRVWERPQVDIIGVLPLHLIETIQDDALPEPLRHKHRLAFIFELKNSSPTPAKVDMAMMDGCAPIDPSVVEPRPSLKEVEEGKVIQRISMSGIIRQDVQVIPQYDTEFIAAIFPFETQLAYLEVPNSISLKGKCDEINNTNKHPSLLQLFDIDLTNRSPKSFRPEIYNGKIKVSILAGNDWIYVNPSSIKKLYSVRWEDWPKLSLEPMYTNPSSAYPPLKGSN